MNNASRKPVRRLSDPQIFCLWAVAAGSDGSGSNARTLESLRRRGLVRGAEHQGGWTWWATEAGYAVIENDPRTSPEGNA